MPANPQQDRDKKFNLMAVTQPRNPNMLKSDRAPLCSVSNSDAFVVDTAVSFDPLQGVIEVRRGCQDVVHQAEFAEINLLRQTHAEKLVLQRIGNEVQKVDLGF